MPEPIRCVRLTKAVVRRAKERDYKPPLNKICPGDRHQRSPDAPKFEDRSQEETEWQEHWAREAAWKVAKTILKRHVTVHNEKTILKLKRKHKATLFSPTEKWCLPSLYRIKPEERELVDSGASMHMISGNDLNSAELETVTTSRYPTTVRTANGEVQTHEEATMYVRDLDKFLTVIILKCTPAVSSMGKLCEDHRYSYEWTNDQKNHISSNMVFGHNVLRRNTYQSWSRVYRRLLPRQVHLVQHL